MDQSEREQAGSQGETENVCCRASEDFGRSETSVEGRESGREVKALTVATSSFHPFNLFFSPFRLPFTESEEDTLWPEDSEKSRKMLFD